ENRYKISKEGKVMTLVGNDPGALLNDNYNGQYKEGYERFQLIDKNGKKKHFYCHLLVWTTFMGEIPKGIVVDHINKNRFDNRLENLRLLTRSESSRHVTRYEKKENDLEIIAKD